MTFDQWQQTDDFMEWQKVQCSLLDCTRAEHSEFLQKLRESGQPPSAYGGIATLMFRCGIPASEIENISTLTDNVPMIELSRGDE